MPWTNFSIHSISNNGHLAFAESNVPRSPSSSKMGRLNCKGKFVQQSTPKQIRTRGLISRSDKFSLQSLGSFKSLPSNVGNITSAKLRKMNSAIELVGLEIDEGRVGLEDTDRLRGCEASNQNKVYLKSLDSRQLFKDRSLVNQISEKDDNLTEIFNETNSTIENVVNAFEDMLWDRKDPKLQSHHSDVSLAVGISTYRPVLPLVLNNFQISPTLPLSEFSSQSPKQKKKLIISQTPPSSKGKLKFSNSSEDPTLSSSSSLPCISNFKSSSALKPIHEESDTKLNESDLFADAIVIEPTNFISDFESTHVFSNYFETLYNLSSASDTPNVSPSRNKNDSLAFPQTSQDNLPSSSAVEPTFEISKKTQLSSDTACCSEPSFPSLQEFLLFETDPNLHTSTTIEDNRTHSADIGSTSAAASWAQFLFDSFQSNDENAWMGGVIPPLENETSHKKEHEGMDICDHALGLSLEAEKNEFQQIILPSEAVFNSSLEGNNVEYFGLPGYSSIDLFTDDSTKQYLSEPRRGKRSICLWQFLKELLLYPEKYQSWIRWVDKNKGVFKIEDSTSVARLWGQRKNRPAMNYDKLSRSIRQYYKKGIIKKTSNSKRLVYQFCPQYL